MRRAGSGGPGRRAYSGQDAPGERLYLAARDKMQRAKEREARLQQVGSAVAMVPIRSAYASRVLALHVLVLYAAVVPICRFFLNGTFESVESQEIAEMAPAVVSTPRSRSAFERRQEATLEKRAYMARLKEEWDEAQAAAEMAEVTGECRLAMSPIVENDGVVGDCR